MSCPRIKTTDMTFSNYNIPEDMEQYLSYYGWHFNKKLYEFAVGMMKDREGKKMTPVNPDELDTLLEKRGVYPHTNELYDAAYLACMAKADFWGSSIEDEEHLAKYVGDVLCDPDGYDGIVFCRFVSDCCAKGIAVFWDRML